MIKKNLTISYQLFIDDVQAAFQNSPIGTLWQSIFLSVQIFAMGPLFAEIFNAKTFGYTLFITINLILWNFISSFLNQSTNAFNTVKHLYSNKDLGIFVPVLKVYYLNLLIFSQNIFIFLILSSFLLDKFDLLNYLYLYFFGIILTFTFIPLGIIIALLSIRFKDFSNIVSNLLLFSFFLSPIIWDSEKVSSNVLDFLNFNPFYHYLLLFKSFYFKSEIFVYLNSLIFIVFLFFITFAIFLIFKNKIVKKNYLFWLFI